MALRKVLVMALILHLARSSAEFVAPQILDHEELAVPSKRYYADNWIDPSYGFASMADANWNWEKRNFEDEEKEVEESRARPIALALRRIWPQHYLFDPRMGRVNYRFQRRPFSNAYSFHSMADADWGMRRKRHLRSIRNTNKILNHL